MTFSGYNVTTPLQPGHIFDVRFDPGTGTATWNDISYDLLDQPVNDAVLDVATGDIYVSTDSGVASAKQGADRLLYAATHGRGAYRLRLK